MTYHVPRTANYRLNSELQIYVDRYGSKTLPTGSFVRPIELKYVPQHVLEKYDATDTKYHVFAYTHYGIIPIPRTQIDEA